MAQSDFHSRLIGWLKILLPLVALGILSTLFLVARTIDPDNAIPYADVDVEDRLREPRMTAPNYAGLTADGAALTIRADEARPASDSGTRASALALSGVLETPDGGRTELLAGAGQIDPGARRILLTDGVTIRSSTGWQVQGENLTAAMDTTDIEMPDAVTATGPAGVVTADSLRLTQAGDGEDSYLLVFNGAVKLVYAPAN
ncbi:hypothetical protein [Pseudotabrizicola algicola]|nr:hypothetical protein [Pseudotabrizicola algicola]